MKRIVLDFLRRWAWLYATGFLLAMGLDVIALTVPSFGVFTPYFLAPMIGPLFVLGVDLMRGAAGVTIALPVSARRIGIAYWLVGVCAPAVLLSLALIFAMIIVPLLRPPIPSGWEQVAWTFIISFLICGFIFFVLTCFKVGPQEGFWNNLVAGLAGALWGVGAFSSLGIKFLLDSRKADAVTIATLAFAALVLTLLGFFRAGTVVISRARVRIAARSSPRTVTTAEPASAQSRLSGFPYLFLESLKFTLGMAVVLILCGYLLRLLLQINSMFVLYALLLCALLPSLRFLTGLRQIRTLPISLNGLAITLFLLPMLNFALCLTLLTLVKTITATGAFDVTPAAVLFSAAIASLANAVLVRFGPKLLPFAFVVCVMALFATPIELLRFPSVAYYAASAALMIAAFMLLRLSLRCSNMYRLPAVGYAVG